MRRFVFSGEASTVFAMHKPVAPAAAAATGGAGKGQAQPGATTPPSPTSNSADLVLFELATRNELTLGNVADFAFDKKGQWLAMTIDTRDQLSNGVQLRNMNTAALFQPRRG